MVLGYGENQQTVSGLLALLASIYINRYVFMLDHYEHLNFSYKKNCTKLKASSPHKIIRVNILAVLYISEDIITYIPL